MRSWRAAQSPHPNRSPRRKTRHRPARRGQRGPRRHRTSTAAAAMSSTTPCLARARLSASQSSPSLRRTDSPAPQRPGEPRRCSCACEPPLALRD
jgi:hypothetical protein